MNNALLIKFLAIPFLLIFISDKNLSKKIEVKSLDSTSIIDTIRPPEEYRGYRLYITQIKVEKESKTSVRIKFSAINTGRKDIDFSRKGTEHWVQIQFDDSLRKSKMGGFEENIRFSLYKNNYKLAAGKVKKGEALEFPKVFKWESLEQAKSVVEVPELVIMSPKGDDFFEKTDEEVFRMKKDCPDLIFANIKVKDSNKKYTTIEFSLANIGKAPAKLSRMEDGKEKLFGIMAHLSGVDHLTRGAIPLGSTYFNPRKEPSLLKPGGILTQTMKLDTRKKTDFLKYIVLSIDAYNVGKECDKTNNFTAISIGEK